MQSHGDHSSTGVPGSRIAAAVLLTLVTAFASGCTTTNPMEFDRATLRGVVIDEDHQPVEWATVSVPGGEVVYTDRNGRFALADVPRGGVRIHAELESFEPLFAECLFTHRTQVVYLQMRSGRFFVLRAVEALESGSGEAAVRFASRGVDLLPGNPEAEFVAALASLLAGDLVAAGSFLDEFTNPTAYEAVTLLRADLSALEANEQ